MGNELKERVALILEAIEDNEIQYGRYDRPIRELIKDLQTHNDKLDAENLNLHNHNEHLVNCHMEAVADGEKLEAESKRLREALNPRTWTREMDNAWHYHVPNVQQAFDALKEAALEPRGSDEGTI